MCKGIRKRLRTRRGGAFRGRYFVMSPGKRLRIRRGGGWVVWGGDACVALAGGESMPRSTTRATHTHKASPVARTQNIPASTVRRWMKQYRDKGLPGLADAKARSDKGKSRRLPASAITLVEGLALQTPRRSMAAIHRQVVAIAAEPSPVSA